MCQLVDLMLQTPDRLEDPPVRSGDRPPAVTVHRPATGETFDLPRPEELGPVTWSEGELVLVDAPTGAVVHFGGQRCRVLRSADSVSTWAVNLDHRPVFGAQRLEVRRIGKPISVDVVTSASLLAVSRVLPAVQHVEHLMPRLRGGFWYTLPDGTPRRLADPRKTVVFVNDSIDSVEHFFAMIVQDPVSRRTLKTQVRPSVPHLDLGATYRLLAKHPELLEEDGTGLLQIRGRRYSPQLVAGRFPVSDLVAVENRRVVAFLVCLYQDFVVSARVAVTGDRELEQLCMETTRRLRRILSSDLVRSVPGTELPNMFEPPIGLEHTHDGYAGLRRLRIAYQSKTSYSGSSTTMRSFVATPDLVYQAWCAYLVAAALELEETASGFRDVGAHPAFHNEAWELFFNSRGAIRSWRATSASPDGFRPDIVLRRRHDNRQIVLLDAKYSSSVSARVPGEQRKEVQAYMNAFGVRSAGVIHPGEPAASGPTLITIASRGHRLAEIGAAPDTVKSADDLKFIGDAVLGLECRLGETYPVPVP